MKQTKWALLGAIIGVYGVSGSNYDFKPAAICGTDAVVPCAVLHAGCIGCGGGFADETIKYSKISNCVASQNPTYSQTGLTQTIDNLCTKTDTLSCTTLFGPWSSSSTSTFAGTFQYCASRCPGG